QPDLTPLPAHDQPAIAHALSKNPDERFPTCLEFLRALRSGGATFCDTPLLPGPADVTLNEILPPAPVDEHAETAAPPCDFSALTGNAIPDEKTQAGPISRKSKHGLTIATPAEEPAPGRPLKAGAAMPAGNDTPKDRPAA